MSFFYGLSTKLYFLSVKAASKFNTKAALMVEGRKNWRENLLSKIDENSKYVWVHCASLGEFEQGRPLIEKIKNQYSGRYKILLTFFSPSGYEIRKNYDKADLVFYLPFDTASNAADFMKIVKPVCAVFVKYEIWLYFLKELNKLEIPTYLISGIFRKNQIFFKWYGKSYRKALKYFSEIFLQDVNSEKILNKYGILSTFVCGDTRTDRVIAVATESYENHLLEKFCQDKKTIVFGSTWPADEKAIARFVNNSDENFRFIIVPHEINEQHLKFTESIIKISTIRYSQIDKIDNQTRVVIVDSIGLLSKIYRYGQIAYVGGGFGKGIHNTLEAAVYNIPVVFGPNYSKFKEARDLIDKNCAFCVRNESDLESIINDIINSPESYDKIKNELIMYITASYGATEHIFNKMHFKD